jgi:pyridinium-3,5-bisthiocarboxylic acid mononucleotide nickel chelatase
MKILYIDTFSGISGDMLLGAFISAGLSLESIKVELSKVPINNYEIAAREIKRNSISAIKVDVNIIHHEHVHRNISDIYKIIDSSSLNEKIKSDSKKIFDKIAVAEAKVHNIPVDKVHFHEVGAIDSIVDIIGAAICIDMFKIDKIYSTPMRVGSSAFVKTQHGQIPIPAPATAEILKNYPTTIVDLPYELTTPTGAAIVSALSSGSISANEFVIENIGYGAGGLEIPNLPNLLRIFIGSNFSKYEKDELVTIDTNIDDMNPQIYPYIIEKVLDLGANDAYITPVIMKKGRPGILLSVVAVKELSPKILEFIYSNTTTIGVRIQEVRREKLKRTLAEFETSYGKTKCKTTEFNGKKTIYPEFEECKRISDEKDIPFIEVQRNLFNELNYGRE